MLILFITTIMSDIMEWHILDTASSDLWLTPRSFAQQQQCQTVMESLKGALKHFLEDNAVLI